MGRYSNNTQFDVLLGKTLTEIFRLEEFGQDELIFETADGERYKMFHYSDCCESVDIDDIAGDLKDLLNSPILLAEEVTSDVNPEGVVKKYQDSFTWTFYKLATINGSVTIRWYGESNGYYSESVSFEKIS